MQQILRGAPAVVVWQPAGSDGEPADPAGPVTVTITTADGTVLATDATTGGTGNAPRTYSLAAQAQLDQLAAVWKVAGVVVAETVVEIIGGFWFTIAQAIDRDEKLADQAKYPTGRLLAARREVEAEFEEVTGQAWVPRFAQIALPGTPSCELVLPQVRLRRLRHIIAINTTGGATPYSADELAAVEMSPWGTLRNPAGWGAHAYRIGVEHGHDSPPADLQAAAITRLRHRLNMVRSGIPDRATSMSTEAGQTFALATPGLRGFVTGIPDVDVVLERYRFVRAGVA